MSVAFEFGCVTFRDISLPFFLVNSVYNRRVISVYMVIFLKLIHIEQKRKRKISYFFDLFCMSFVLFHFRSIFHLVRIVPYTE